MKTTRAPKNLNGAFTLIELLVVIAIIGVLAALLFPTIAGIRNKNTKTKAQGELEAVKTAIDRYKDKFGFYPPDNPTSPLPEVGLMFNQLYFELVGTSLKGAAPNKYFESLDGSVQISQQPVNDVTNAFGTAVGGFVNCTKGGDTENTASAVNFLKSLKPDQYGTIANNGVTVRLLACSIPWPADLPLPGPLNVTQPNGTKLNPWRYNSSNPTHNPGAYDLWIDVLIGGKTNRISNWSKQPQLVAAPL